MEQQIAVERIRKFNRFYTNILGLLNKGLLDSPYSLSEVRLMLEIDRMERCTFARLTDLLNIDRGLASRLLKKLESDGIVSRRRSVEDKRVEHLELTEKGGVVFSELEGKSNGQVAALIGHLSCEEQEKLVQSMEYIMACLYKGRDAARIRPYLPEDVDYVIDRHKELYRKDYGFGHTFGSYVEKPVRTFHEHRNPACEQMWIAEIGGRPAGAIAVVKACDGIAQLRWFFVDPEARGRGLGGSLIEAALNFCREAGYRRVILWTADVLKVSRRMYAAHGFVRTETKENTSWTGEAIQEEKWELVLRV